MRIGPIHPRGTFFLLTLATLGAISPSLSARPTDLSEADASRISASQTSLKTLLTELHAQQPGADSDDIADAELFARAAEWALRYEPTLSPADTALIERALRRGTDRARDLRSGRKPWVQRQGRLVRGYVSAVDGSVQPYGLIVPKNYRPGTPIRLDVVLHGSSRPTGMSELRFLAPFDREEADAATPDVNYIELHPLGRVENCYRWAGETDVFEAIADVCRDYTIDQDRIVLRGMSMGASGTWHLGLKHPDRFVALGPYCGYVDTHQFSLTPQQNFVPVGPLPPHQELALHMLDSVDYAANAGVVPAIAAIGDKDPFFQAHVIMGNAMDAEGLKMVNLISPGTGHIQDPVTFAEQMRRIDGIASAGLDHTPRHLRFVTWTLKYSRCHWLEALGLREHYQRTEVDASLAADGSVTMQEPKNLTRLALLPPALAGDAARLSINGKEIPLPGWEKRRSGVVIEQRGGNWRYVGNRQTARLSGKRPGLQGPIDDALAGPFLCVRGTGKPWNPEVGAWADASLQRFTREWSRYFRGDARVKDDTAVTPEDLRRYHLILFGDGGSNRFIRQALPKLPLKWNRSELRLGNKRYSATDHAPCLISPNPLSGGEGHYVVLNSGHTFHEKELSTLNYLLFPRLGDWAVMKIGTPTAAGEVNEIPEQAGYFNEEWKLPKELAAR